jgi:hypothetical protein
METKPFYKVEISAEFSGTISHIELKDCIIYWTESEHELQDTKKVFLDMFRTLKNKAKLNMCTFDVWKCRSYGTYDREKLVSYRITDFYGEFKAAKLKKDYYDFDMVKPNTTTLNKIFKKYYDISNNVAYDAYLEHCQQIK